MGFWDQLLDFNCNGKTDAADLWILHQIMEYEKEQDREEKELEAYLSGIDETELFDGNYWGSVSELSPEQECIPSADKFDTSMTPEDVPPEKEPVDDKKYAWRKDCLRNPEYGVFPEKYETEREYYHAYLLAKLRYYDFDAYRAEVEQAKLQPDEKYEWRKYCVRNPEYGISPEDYENRMDYYRAFLARKRSSENSERKK